MADFYQILQVSPRASLGDIRRAYQTRAREYHPDKVSHLGTELQQLATEKMLLINEAYRTLSSEQSRAMYDSRTRGQDFEPVYAICRSCGHRLLVEMPRGDLPETCPACGESMRNRKLKGAADTQDSREFPWEILVGFLKQSVEHISTIELPASAQIRWENLHYHLDRLPDGRFCLSTHFQKMCSSLNELLPGEPARWDEETQTGICYPGYSAQEVCNTLQRLDSFFPAETTLVSLNAGERSGGLAEPNLLLLSAVNDVSIASAHKAWLQSEKNLYHVEWNPDANWQERLAECFRLAYGESRAPRETSALSENMRQCLETIEKQVRLIREQVAKGE